MKIPVSWRAILAFALVTGHITCAMAQGATALEVRDAWARVSHASGSASIYFEIVNPSPTPDQLVGVWTPVAERAAIMKPRWRGLKMSMEKVDGVSVAGPGQISLRPGSYEITITHLTRDFHAGQSIPLELHFDGAGRMEIRAMIYNRMLKNHKD